MHVQIVSPLNCGATILAFDAAKGSYQVKIPLDIIWMNMRHQVVEISANTPPCPSKSAKLCPGYGGAEKSIFVLELAGGSVARYNIRVGDIIQF